MDLALYPVAPPGPGDLRCECGHLVTVHGVDRGCVLCPCDRLSGLHRTLIARPDDGAPAGEAS